MQIDSLEDWLSLTAFPHEPDKDELSRVWPGITWNNAPHPLLVKDDAGREIRWDSVRLQAVLDEITVVDIEAWKGSWVVTYCTWLEDSPEPEMFSVKGDSLYDLVGIVRDKVGGPGGN